jgi:hypothetical protein
MRTDHRQERRKSSGSGDLAETHGDRSFDRDPDIYGIRALKSCRARQYTCSIWCDEPRLEIGTRMTGDQSRG